MKALSIFFLGFVIVSGCKKPQLQPTTTQPIAIDPPTPVIVSADTVRQGRYMEFTIGEKAADVYSQIQNTSVVQNVTSLQIVSNIIYNIDSLKNRLTLYKQIFLDQKTGTADGIQIYFNADTVQSIFTNSGVKLNRWPSDTDDKTTVYVGNTIYSIYPKLVNIAQISKYAPWFQKMAVFTKDVPKPYDPMMTASPQWYYRYQAPSGLYTQIQLFFTNGVLTSIVGTTTT